MISGESGLQAGSATKRIRYCLTGVVQGVGFRPFIYRLAVKHGIKGFVNNSPEGVTIEAEGNALTIASFYADFMANLPPLAEVASVVQEEIEPRNDTTFQIMATEMTGKGDVHITPDVATCSDCLKELRDPPNRRYRYPFINCTNCGPRFTIINNIPYDRVHTSMACFPLCPLCRKEYEDPADRRFHAEPNACPTCGPTLSLLDEKGNRLDVHDVIQKSIDLLHAGSILAIKGLGGYHLCVDAVNHEAVKRLRLRKYREEKPLAIMVRDIAAASQLAHIGKEEEGLLLSPEHPIVLLPKKETALISTLVAPGMKNLGIMLPYTPLQHLLMEDKFTALVMTSANQTDEPICIKNREAIRRLAGIADYFLVHDRDILVRCDDSVAVAFAGKKTVSRRSRGYAPKPLSLRDHYPSVLALGPQLKSSICILKDQYAFLSPHIGDMETPQARDFFHETIAIMERITESQPKSIACDLHPAYYSSLFAGEMKDAEVIPVQHHHAHIVSCMAEHGLSGEVIGLAMDGTGYGTDGHIWGGEFLRAGESSFTRMGYLREFMLPGGDKAIREPWRIAASLLYEAYGDLWLEHADRFAIGPDQQTRQTIQQMMIKGINIFPTSSLGRLFDGVAAIIGLRTQVSFEGQAAMELEAIANRQNDMLFPFPIVSSGNDFILDTAELIRGIVTAMIKGKSRESLASAFHTTLAFAFKDMALHIRRTTGINRIILSGGCFQNRLLLEGCLKDLEKEAFDIYFHQRVPTNDGGIALGQAVCAGAMIKNKRG